MKFWSWICGKPRWRLVYPDGRRTVFMPYGLAKNYRDVFGGTLEYANKDQRQKLKNKAKRSLFGG